MDYQKIIKEIYEEVKNGKPEGEVASYIPELSNVNPDKFGIALLTVDGNEFTIGDADEKFSIQSISKVFALSIAFSILGEKIWDRTGVEPSGNSFNSIMQLE